MIKHINIKEIKLELKCPICNKKIIIEFNKENCKKEFFICKKCMSMIIIQYRLRAYKYLLTKKEQFFIKVVKKGE